MAFPDAGAEFNHLGEATPVWPSYKCLGNTKAFDLFGFVCLRVVKAHSVLGS